MANVQSWSDAEKAEELGDWVQNDEALYREHGLLVRWPTEDRAREFYTRAAVRYNAECLRGFPGADFSAAIERLVVEMLEGGDDE